LRPALVVLLLLPLSTAPASAQLRGHGGPVRALALSPDASEAVSGSFDSSAIRWSLERNAAAQVLRFHEGAVNAVAWLRDGRLVTAGEDARLALWRPGAARPAAVLTGHAGPVVSLAVSPDGAMLASASWDRSARVWSLAGEAAPRVLEGHNQNVNAVAFTPDGRALVSAGYDATLRIWPLTGNAAAQTVTLPTPLNAVVVAPDGEILAAGADGKVYFVSAADAQTSVIDATPDPIVALALSPDGRHLAAAGIRGSVVIIGPQVRAHPGRPGPAGLVARLLSRRPHASDRRHRPPDPALGCDHRGAHRRRCAGSAGRPSRRLCGRPRGRGVPRLCRLPHPARG
jgi:cytochrome c